MSLFGNESKRRINLGGIGSTPSPNQILSQVRAERARREQERIETENATKIQAWYRGIHDVRQVRSQLRREFERDVTGIKGLRCLALLGRDEEALSLWCTSINPHQIYAPVLGENKTSWLVLVRKITVQLLQSLSTNPRGPNSLQYLVILDAILSPDVASATAGDLGRSACADITRYLLHRRFFDLLGTALQSTPPQAKSSNQIQSISKLVTRPFVILDATETDFANAMYDFLVSVLTVHLLPNRLAVAALPSFTTTLTTHISAVQSRIDSLLDCLSLEGKVDLTANLYTFFSPNYKSLKPSPLVAYLDLSTRLLSQFSLGSTQKPKVETKTVAGGLSLWTRATYEHESDDEAHTKVTTVSSFSTPTVSLPSVQVDEKTAKKLSGLATASHLSSLISVSKPTVLPHIISYLSALTASWPAVFVDVLNTVQASSRGALITQIYRELVRPALSSLSSGSLSLFDASEARKWPPILFLVDLYSQAMLTMGDDEFFGTQKAAGSSRNPLSLDELIVLSRQLLAVALNLYLRDNASLSSAVGWGVSFTWETAREKITKFLVAIHARDSRRSFVPEDHWLTLLPGDMNSFVEAALIEEQQLSKDRRPLSRRQVSSLAPRLGILNNIPFAVPFEVRVSIFRHFVMNDMREQRYDRHSAFPRRPRIPIRRAAISQDGFDKLGDIDLKAPVEIVFIDQFGQEEAGIDGGGIFKEFFTSLCAEIFDTDRGLWLANKKNELYPNPHEYATEPHSLNWYRFLGRILGKAMYEGILVDVAFASFFLAKWLGKQSYLDDLASLDPDLYNGLLFLKHYTGTVEDLSLNFTVAIEEFGVTKSIDLIPNGSNVPVTKENRLIYINLVSLYRLSKQIKRQSEAFFEGLSEMIDPKWLRMFNQHEVQILIGGVNSPVDLDDLRRHTNYGGLYDDNHEVIKSFWRVVNGFDHEQRRSLLRFVTSCSRPPLLGFKELVPNFSIRDAGEDQYRLPTSSTCVNLLKLPRYTTDRQLRAKLLQAINSNAGFDLS